MFLTVTRKSFLHVVCDRKNSCIWQVIRIYLEVKFAPKQRELLQKFRGSLKISREPGSLVPREYPTLLDTLFVESILSVNIDVYFAKGSYYKIGTIIWREIFSGEQLYWLKSCPVYVIFNFLSWIWNSIFSKRAQWMFSILLDPCFISVGET